MREHATTTFEKDFYKLMNNSVFGKSLENIRNRVNVTLCNDEIKAKKLIALPTFKHEEIINSNLVKFTKTNRFTRDSRFWSFLRHICIGSIMTSC